ncbi:uncharacterized protein BXZ73DRAFT_82833 [Epithele typhae]|uniref:uncharacterized protein n=1 Tax=Epithele typhae TaxID=378194 RepID=UPI002007FBA1|nr:uncharacterized protein BXZ73DRAFT_82833 [Epithele typhae]KAH9911357.1 hypothetical protein BXZ73DRAFT_82833 [Epithele typhae]
MSVQFGGYTAVFAAILAFSSLPGAHAYCYFDRFGVEHFVALVVFLIAFRLMRARASRRRNLAYVNTSAVSGAVPPAGYPTGAPGYYPYQGGPAPNDGYAPQYPMPTYTVCPKSSQSPPSSYYAQYSPPVGIEGVRGVACGREDGTELDGAKVATVFVRERDGGRKAGVCGVDDGARPRIPAAAIFSRARTTSTPNKKTAFDLGAGAHDEFGRIPSRGSGRPDQSLTANRKGSKKDGGGGRTTPRPGVRPPDDDPTVDYGPPDGSFLPLVLDRPRYETDDDSPFAAPTHDYGYLSFERHVVLGLEEIARLVDVVGEELGTRGLTVPFIFSSLALDVSATSVKRLVQVFLKTCSKPSGEAERQWREEARLAGPPELGMTLRWGLARVVRWTNGQEVRGLVSYDMYLQWRDSEAAMNYPGMHFSAFLDRLEPQLQFLLVGLFTLLSRFIAHSASSGHTPPTLSPLFGPLLFGLGPSTLNFHHAYLHYLRAAIATEHLILAFIRWQDAKASSSSPGSVPTRLKAWIQGYPSMLPLIGKNERPEPRRGARTVRVMSVRRNVRMYSPDLVKTTASWAYRPKNATSSAGEMAFAGSREWDRISPPTLKLPPRYSDSYKKRMVLGSNFHPDTGAAASSGSLPPSLSSSVSSASSVTSTLFDDKEGEERFRSLTDLKWGEFEAMGFGTQTDEKKLQFDLTEGARAARAAKRATLNWQDFSSAGFSRSDAHLSATLQFSAPVANTIQSWPVNQAEMHRKLKKTQKALPAFGWDTEPVIGSEEVIEEAFVDVFCDLIYGGGWMDDERRVETDRECNWALVEFKALPVQRTTVSGTADPRTATTLILFEEFVPFEYRQQLVASAGGARRRLPSLFSSTNKSKQWKPAATLNGRPYVLGAVPHTPSYREAEFEGLLRSNGSSTKVITLKREKPTGVAAVTPPLPVKEAHTGPPLVKVTSPLSRAMNTLRSDSPVSPKDENGSPQPKKGSRLRLPGLPSSPAPPKRAGLTPTEYEQVDFDTRIASFEEEGSNKRSRRRSKDDAWVDILVATNSRRIGGQDAEMRHAALKGGRSDPELASQELSEVLAGVRGRRFSDDEDEGMEPVADPHGDTDTLQDSMLEREDSDSVRYGRADDDAEVKPRRRVGYFDLHPERRPPTLTDDPRDQISRPSYESDTSTENPYAAGTVQTRAHLNVDDSESSYRQSTASDYEPEPKVVPEPPKPAPKEAKPLRALPDPHGQPEAPEPPTKGSSKTATLIEMYRERERQNSSSPIPSSRLPVRQASLTASNGKTSPHPSPTPAVVDIPEIESTDDKVSVEDIEIDLPTRYVHGAPLHNVLEEEEEE